ncbi:hypothetical protein Pst134EA_013387 [Puccinia striiformis f. sp. tritici]|uniref:hypothetical protein n=1 Tax=Puccinia striiformis f. sp. tritici TaxID=168172 RepID=UPI002008AE2F|nr:hypothetical protein Pst134EA_013387 [Puccinia striiformis f. sp. tritici]KAH9465507.1 hypothetical protein Pst134EA_013387 [Puccinia striiformis f. sp. tritici]
MESSTFSESDNRAGPSQCVTAEQKTYLSAVAGGPDPEQSTRPLSPTPQPEHPALSDFQLTKRIGQGSWGDVFVARRRIDGHHSAMKVMSKRHCAISSVYDTLKKEAQILASLDHTFIVKIEAAFQTQDCLFIGLELAVGGTFSDLLEMFAPMDPIAIKFYVCQVVVALDYLHEQQIVHGDLKPDNLLIDINGYIKVADFGLARRLTDHTPPNLHFGAVYYMAPEMINGTFFGTSIDWWALGVMLYQGLFASFPFDLERLPTSNQRFSQDDQDRVKILISSGQYTIPYPIDFPCLSFLKRLLSQSHNRRLLNMNSICDEYIYFAKVNWNHLSERRYEAPYTPGDSASYITPTRRDWSPKFATRLIPRKSDQFPGLFDDFYFLGAGSPW